MKRLLAAAALLGLALLEQGRLCAQVPVGNPPGPVSTPRPAVSPYINLLRNNNPTYLNYYGLVRPQLAFQGQINGLQQEYAAGENSANSYDPTTGLPLTGHPTQFFNTSHYFFNRGGTGAAGATGGAAAAGVRPAMTNAALNRGSAAPANGGR